MKQKRRVFIKNSVLASAGITLGAPTYIKDYMQQKPSDFINVAVCGINGRGKSHYATFTGIKDTRVVALCDPVDYLFPDAIAAIEKLGVNKASGDMAQIAIRDIPDGTDWEINDYDGIESIHEAHSIW